ncbi:hypothetical protein L0U85_02070 [Glycomyces sp. L485]|uniref:hypothetical protein n=1 Tax=Glycomyces sp. L485 TaxID=2909235 RepID=UPI001F4B68FB|nr:hypothetical protein [Glycomyces sp. L485]MCH7229653.1 hypothetical protein [Glycomyces sp. L485]
MASIDEVISSIDANTQAVSEIGAQIESSKQQAEEVLTALQQLGIEAAGHALSAAKDQLEECLTQNAALAQKLEQARGAAEASKHA